MQAYDPDGWRQRYYPGAYPAGLYTFDPTVAYDAFGKRLGDTDALTGAAETYQDPVGFGGQYGYYSDPETGLSLLTHRYYDSGTGRFVNRDPTGYAGGLNLHGYAGDNPVNECDPSGFDPNGHTVGDWIDNHLLHGAIDNWGNVQGLYDSGRATLAERNWAAVKGSTQVVLLATTVVGTGVAVKGAVKIGSAVLALRAAKTATLAAGALRASMYSDQWVSAPLEEAIERHAGPNFTTWITKTGKQIYENPKTMCQVVVDLKGGYFRIFQPVKFGSMKGAVFRSNGQSSYLCRWSNDV